MIKDRWVVNPYHYNYLLASRFKGVIDLVKMKGIVWQNEDLGAKFDYVDIPDDLKEKANK